MRAAHEEELGRHRAYSTRADGEASRLATVIEQLHADLESSKEEMRRLQSTHEAELGQYKAEQLHANMEHLHTERLKASMEQLHVELAASKEEMQRVRSAHEEELGHHKAVSTRAIADVEHLRAELASSKESAKDIGDASQLTADLAQLRAELADSKEERLKLQSAHEAELVRLKAESAKLVAKTRAELELAREENKELQDIARRAVGPMSVVKSEHEADIAQLKTDLAKTLEEASHLSAEVDRLQAELAAATSREENGALAESPTPLLLGFAELCHQALQESVDVPAVFEHPRIHPRMLAYAEEEEPPADDAVIEQPVGRPDYIATADDAVDLALAEEIKALGPGILQGYEMSRTKASFYKFAEKKVFVKLGDDGRVNIRDKGQLIPLQKWLASVLSGPTEEADDLMAGLDKNSPWAAIG